MGWGRVCTSSDPASSVAPGLRCPRPLAGLPGIRAPPRPPKFGQRPQASTVAGALQILRTARRPDVAGTPPAPTLPQFEDAAEPADRENHRDPRDSPIPPSLAGREFLLQLGDGADGVGLEWCEVGHGEPLKYAASATARNATAANRVALRMCSRLRRKIICSLSLCSGMARCRPLSRRQVADPALILRSSSGGTSGGQS